MEVCILSDEEVYRLVKNSIIYDYIKYDNELRNAIFRYLIKFLKNI